MALLEVDGLAKRFGGLQVIENLSFQVQAGQVHAIIGPNGAGKTTLLNLMTGIYTPDAGRVRLDGRDLTGQPTHRWAAAGLGRTFQNLQVFFNMSALDNVMTGRHLHENTALLPQFLTVLKDYEMMVFGAVLIATMVFFPRGIVPTLARLGRRR